MLITLNRIDMAGEYTHGILSIRSETLCHVLERPWLDNMQNVSCIPPGAYEIEPHVYHGHPVWKLIDVPGRYGILIHAGNTVNDTQGCILPGRRWDSHSSAVTDSRDMMQILLRRFRSGDVISIVET